MTKGAAALRLLLLRLNLSAGLSSLPVVGSQVPEEVDVRLTGLRVDVANRPLVSADVTLVNALLTEMVSDGKLLLLPDAAWPGRTRLGLNVELGGKVLLLGSQNGSPAPPPPNQGPVVQTGGNDLGGTPSTAWYTVDQVLGPVHVDRLGVGFADGTVWLLVDAGVELGGLKLAGRGMGLGVPLNDPARITPRLDGLGIGFSRPPIEISGALINQVRKGYLVSLLGAAVINVPSFSLSAVAGYAQRVDAQPSLFVFGQLGFPAGQGVGPPPFRVTGAAAGFGYNSTVRLPDISEIDTFPFMPSAAGSGGTDAMELADSLTTSAGGKKPWVSEAPGRVWLAAGLRFDSFQFIHARALVLGEFGLSGSDISLALLGQADADFPLKSTGSTRYAHVSLALLATYTSRENALRVQAQIQPGSFLVHPSCRLSGDAAFVLWFGPQHAGDFVLTVGGYHPKFQVPDHYPRARRLAIEWDAGPVSLRGACYAALTPSAFMVGAELDVAFHEGPIHAWCRAVLDALIQWDPFQFRVTLSVRIGVRIDILIPISAEIGVDLDLWGPPTGGIAHVHVAFGWTFDVRFGEDPPAHPKLLDWDRFVAQMLPGPVVQVLVETGRLPAKPAGGAAEKPDEICEVSRDGFTVLTRTGIPASQIVLATPGHTGKTDPGKTITVRPAGATATSVHKVTVTHDGAVVDPVEDPYRWTVEHVTGKVPLGLWGKALGSADQAPPLPVPKARPELTDGLTGALITAPRRSPAGWTVKAAETAIGRETQAIPEKPLLATAQSGSAPTRPYDRGKLAAKLTGTDRKPLLDALAACQVAPPPGGSLTDSLADYAEHIHSYLRTDPMTRSSET
ncbi:hypothetical protein CG736_06080 [Kitasatospora sp. CB02891]|nr:hypothetical protein CG736_06080 [Kitasatospora sp. CB02891]